MGHKAILRPSVRLITAGVNGTYPCNRTGEHHVSTPTRSWSDRADGIALRGRAGRRSHRPALPRNDLADMRGADIEPASQLGRRFALQGEPTKAAHIVIRQLSARHRPLSGRKREKWRHRGCLGSFAVGVACHPSPCLERSPVRVGCGRLGLGVDCDRLEWPHGRQRDSTYNVLAIPTAAGVLFPATGFVLGPQWSALLMSASSFIVATNALLLKRIDRQLPKPAPAQPRT
jgi:hypothetical protein